MPRQGTAANPRPRHPPVKIQDFCEALAGVLRGWNLSDDQLAQLVELSVQHPGFEGLAPAVAAPPSDERPQGFPEALFKLVDPQTGTNQSRRTFLRAVQEVRRRWHFWADVLLWLTVWPLPAVGTSEPFWSDDALVPLILTKLNRLGAPTAAPDPSTFDDKLCAFAPKNPEVIEFQKAWLTTECGNPRFYGWLAWAALQNPFHLKQLLKCDGGNKNWSSEELLEALDWLWSGAQHTIHLDNAERGPKAMLRAYRAKHCQAEEGECCPCADAKPLVLREADDYEWCRCCHPLVTHIDGLHQLPYTEGEQAETLFPQFKASMKELVSRIGADMPERRKMPRPKLDSCDATNAVPQMIANDGPMLMHAARCFPYCLSSMYEHSTAEARQDVFRSLLAWTLPKGCTAQGGLGGWVPGRKPWNERIYQERCAALRELLDPPFDMRPPNWSNPVAAQWWSDRNGGRDPNVEAAAVGVSAGALPQGLQVLEESASGAAASRWWEDPERLAAIRAGPNFVDISGDDPVVLVVPDAVVKSEPAEEAATATATATAPKPTTARWSCSRASTRARARPSWTGPGLCTTTRGRGARPRSTACASNSAAQCRCARRWITAA